MEEKQKSRYDRLTENDYDLARGIKALIESKIGLCEVADVGFNYERLDDDTLTIHVDFYTESKDGEISPAIDI